MDYELIAGITKEIRSFIRSNFGKRATEEEVREYFDDTGYLEETWGDGVTATLKEAETAFEDAIAQHNESARAFAR